MKKESDVKYILFSLLQLKEIRSAGRGTDTPNGQFLTDLVTGSERCAREETIFLRSLSGQYFVRTNDCQIEGRSVLLGRTF